MVEAVKGEFIRRRIPGMPAGVAMVALLTVIVVVSTAIYFGTRSTETPRFLSIEEQEDINDQYEQGHADSMVAMRQYAYIPTPFPFLNARGHQFQWNTSIIGWGLSDEQSKDLLVKLTPKVEKWVERLKAVGAVAVTSLADPSFESLPQVIHQDVANAQDHVITRISFQEDAEMAQIRSEIDQLIDENLTEEQKAARAADASQKDYHPEEMNWYVIHYDGRTLLVREFRGQSVGYPSFNTPWPWNSLDKSNGHSL